MAINRRALTTRENRDYYHVTGGVLPSRHGVLAEGRALREKTEALLAAGCLIVVVVVAFAIVLWLLFTRGS